MIAADSFPSQPVPQSPTFGIMAFAAKRVAQMKLQIHEKAQELAQASEDKDAHFKDFVHQAVASFQGEGKLQGINATRDALYGWGYTRKDADRIVAGMREILRMTSQ